jgi:DNA-binding response OmpR family regulator
MKKKVLYIEDEAYLSRVVKDTLEMKGYEVLHRKDGSRLMEQVNAFAPDICLLDVMLPDTDGFTLGNHIRNVNPTMPIIFLTARTQPADIVKGFSSGGTDYVKKPFSMEELIARIENQLKLMSKDADAMQSLPEEVVLKAYRFYPGRFELHTPSGVVKLSNRESQILAVLCANTNASVDRRELLQLVWGNDSFFNSRNLDVYIRKIRNYFAGADGIEIVTLKGKGYHFVVT